MRDMLRHLRADSRPCKCPFQEVVIRFRSETAGENGLQAHSTGRFDPPTLAPVLGRTGQHRADSQDVGELGFNPVNPTFPDPSRRLQQEARSSYQDATRSEPPCHGARGSLRAASLPTSA